MLGQKYSTHLSFWRNRRAKIMRKQRKVEARINELETHPAVIEHQRLLKHDHFLSCKCIMTGIPTFGPETKTDHQMRVELQRSMYLDVYDDA